jgi:hypothetical protein
MLENAGLVGVRIRASALERDEGRRRSACRVRRAAAGLVHRLLLVGIVVGDLIIIQK